MNTERVSQAFLVLVNAGVLLSVVLLIFELRQNREIAIAEIRNDISRQVVERDMYLSSAEISSIFVKGRKGEELTELESEQLNRALGIIIQGLENIVYQYEAGMYSDEEFEAVERRLGSMPPVMLEYYKERRSDYSTSFQNLMARINDIE